MKCKSCGANYDLLERTCPYCGANNALGKFWGSKITSTQAQNAAAKEEAARRTPRLVYANVIRQILFLEIGLLVLILIGSFLFFFLEEKFTNLRIKFNHDKYETELSELYKAEDWDGLYTYMDDRDLFGVDDYDYYTQPALLSYSFQEFTEYRLHLEDVSKKDPYDNRDWYIERIIRESGDLLKGTVGSYDSEYNIAEAQLKTYTEVVEQCLLYQLKLDPEDVDYIREEDYIYSDEKDALIQKAMERNGWEVEEEDTWNSEQDD